MFKVCRLSLFCNKCTPSVHKSCHFSNSVFMDCFKLINNLRIVNCHRLNGLSTTLAVCLLPQLHGTWFHGAGLPPVTTFFFFCRFAGCSRCHEVTMLVAGF